MTASPRIEAVAFDLDGLLVNTEELYQHVGTELLRRRGRSFEPDLLDAMMGRPQKVSLAIMIEWHGLADTIEMLATETGEIFVSLLDTQLRTMPGAMELLDLLDARGIARRSRSDARARGLAGRMQGSRGSRGGRRGGAGRSQPTARFHRRAVRGRDACRPADPVVVGGLKRTV